MKLNPENRKKLNAVRKALLLGVPISGMVLAAGTAAAADKDSSRADEAAKSKMQAKKTVSIDPMSLYSRGVVMTPGVICPPPIVMHLQEYIIRLHDSWEKLAIRYNTPLEIMLRINAIPIGTVWKILESKTIPENLKLVPGQKIYVPENKREKPDGSKP